eukprot:814112_1
MAMAKSFSSRVWVVPKVGSLSSLCLQEQSIEPPQPGYVQIEARAVGLNFADIFACKGLYEAAAKENFTPGFELSGVITAVGEDRKGGSTTSEEDSPAGEAAPLRVGDKVFALTRFGGYCTRLNVDRAYVARIPDSWSFEEAAAFPTQAFTAYYALRVLASVRAGQTVLVHSAAGGVGQSCLKILAKIGAKVIATVGSSGKVDFLTEKFNLKSEQIILRTTAAEFGKQIDEALASIDSTGLDVVLDSLLGDFFFPAYSKLSMMGRHIVYGAASMTTPGDGVNWLSVGWRYINRPKLDLLPMINQNRSVMAFNLVYLFGQTGLIRQGLAELTQWDLGACHVGETFAFEDAPNALRKLQSGQTVGKLVLRIEPDLSSQVRN